MPENVSLPTIKSESLFEVPVWRSRVPQLFARHAEMQRDLIDAYEAGKFQRHRHGYGYQTAATLFNPESLAQYPYLDILRQAFVQNVSTILRQRGGLATAMPFRISAVLGWALLQTNEAWVNGTWHDHYPATISGCYYLKMPHIQGELEGALAFQRPSPQDMFVEHIRYIKPLEGEFILFPSSLCHRPEPCPSADGIRISINMDAYVEWGHLHGEDGSSMSPAEFNQKLRDSHS
jgi:hypothetical protein